MQIHGDFYAVNQSKRHRALLVLTADKRINIKSEQSSEADFIQNVALSDIEVSPRLGDTPRSLTFADGSLFETQDNETIDTWLKNESGHNPLGWIHRLESKIGYVLMTLVFVVIFSWGFIQFGVPAIADSTAQVLPNEVNQYLGKGTLKLLDNGFFSESQLSAHRQAELINTFNRYAEPYKELNIKVVFRQGGKVGANAFALPDGHIVFTDEMVELAKNDNELVAIFGHEIGHLERRHLLRRVIQDSLLASLVVLVTGDVSYASSVVIALPALLLELAYSRQFEEEADQFALNFLNENKIASDHFAHIMLRMTNNDKSQNTQGRVKDSTEFSLSDYLSSHPMPKERIKPFLTKPISN